MKALGDYIHSKGLKFGIYSCAGSMTCQNRPGSRGYQFQDARQYAEWGVDFLKYDWCYSEGQNAEAAYKTMSDALIVSGRPIVFSICEWGRNEPWMWGKGIGHLWRTTGDIRDCWDCEFEHVSGGVVTLLDLMKHLHKFAGPGHWNDADMLEVGNESLSDVESQSHFALWCMIASPLMAGNDIRTMSDATRNILTNKEMIAINQDPEGNQASILATFSEGDRKMEVYKKRLENNGLAVCFFNRSDTIYSMDLTWDILEIEGNYHVRDVWEHKDLITTHEIPNITYNIPAHGVKVFRLK